MRDIDRLSITQLKEYAESPRRWALRYLEGFEDGPSPHLTFGLAVHRWLENHMRGSENIDHGLQSEENVDFLINWAKYSDWFQPQTFRTEQKIGFWIDPELPMFSGIIDLHRVVDGKGEIVDHKTANPRYAKDERSLKRDWQTSLYLYALMQPALPQLNENDIVGTVSLNYFSKERREDFIGEGREDLFDLLKNWRVSAQLTKAELLKNIDEIKQIAFNLMQDVVRYKEEGIMALNLGSSKKYRYGAYDILWPYLTGELPVEHYHTLQQERAE